MRFLVLASAFLVSSAWADEPVSFAAQIVPVLKSQCATCHLTGQEPGRMALHPAAAYASLVGVPSTEAPLRRVEPGKPDVSYLILKLEGTHLDHGGQGARMPFGGPKLDPVLLTKIRQWIQDGAPNN